MDAPLLALTRRRPGALAGPSQHAAAADNMRQLIQLRWIAVVGQLFTILLVHFGLGVPLPLGIMLPTVGLLAAFNVAETIALPRHRVTNTELLLALLFDMGALTVQLYCSGGADNPFISLYLVQVVLGAILLKTWSAWALVAATGLAYGLLTTGSRPLRYPPDLETVGLHTLGTWLGFVLAGVLLVVFIGRISRNLRARDLYLAEARERAAEADGIVRMGLFASGAAHELGTPLATLSVILADWRRMPKIANDPELAAEVAEMDAEVRRCKAIVTDVLHSAGEPRGEAMESAPAALFIDEVTGAWRDAHPSVPLEVATGCGPQAAVVADPALRQAIWNILDNAAEVSPDRISLRAECEGEQLVVTVTDRGPGFPPEQLHSIGKLYQSSKGAGHGLGLFLAVNVARRLGGRLEAANRDTGGAAVSLYLPLVAGRLGDGTE